MESAFEGVLPHPGSSSVADKLVIDLHNAEDESYEEHVNLCLQSRKDTLVLGNQCNTL